MKNVNISVLFEKPEFTQSFMLDVLPLAPLSLVSSMPGAYYRSMREPTEYMICGMLENMMGWHFDENDKKVRSKLLKAITQHYKKKYKIKFEYKNACSEVKFYPVIYHLLKFENSIIPPSTSFDDLWTQHLIGTDERHLKGSRNYDWRVDHSVSELYGADGKTKTEYFKNNTSRFPMYYASPKRREYIQVEGSYKYRISTTQTFYQYLKNALKECDTAYLGNSEGWVQLQIQGIQ